MNNVGILSNYSSSGDSVYGLGQVSVVKGKQEVSNAKNQQENVYPNNEIKDEAIISDEAKNLLASEQDKVKKESKAQENKEENNQAAKFKDELTMEEKQQISDLKARDMEVRAHEQAHIAAAAGISASAPTFEYEHGPDGNKYAVAGEVSLSFVEGEDPAANIAKAEIMKSAALAPANPSSQDLSVARHADMIIMSQRQELSQQNIEETQGTTDSPEKENTQNEATNTKPKQSTENTNKNTTEINVGNHVNNDTIASLIYNFDSYNSLTVKPVRAS